MIPPLPLFPRISARNQCLKTKFLKVIISLVSCIFPWSTQNRCFEKLHLSWPGPDIFMCDLVHLLPFVLIKCHPWDIWSWNNVFFYLLKRFRLRALILHPYSVRRTRREDGCIGKKGDFASWGPRGVKTPPRGISRFEGDIFPYKSLLSAVRQQVAYFIKSSPKKTLTCFHFSTQLSIPVFLLFLLYIIIFCLFKKDHLVSTKSCKMFDRQIALWVYYADNLLTHLNNDKDKGSISQYTPKGAGNAVAI